MAIINFPAVDDQGNPIQAGYQYTSDYGTAYVYDGVKWVGRASTLPPGTSAITQNGHTIQVDGDGNLVTDAFTIPNAAGTTGQVLKWPASGTTLEWAADNAGSSGTSWSGITNINNNFGPETIAVGTNAGETSQGGSAVALGYYAGHTGQGGTSIAIGQSAGQNNQGAGSIAIGAFAGQDSQPASSIIINGTGTTLDADPANSGFYVTPVREDTGNTTKALYYDVSTNEITYTNPTAGGSLHSLPDVNVSGMTDGQVLTWNQTGTYWENRDPTGGASDPDGGVADNSLVISDIGYQLQVDQNAYDVSGEVDFLIINENITDGIAVATGLIIKGLTVDHTQTIEGAIGGDRTTISWGSAGIDYQLWQQVVSVTIYVTDSRGYTFYAVARDMWEVPHGPCLVEGTQITMADGTHKAIEDIEHGELVRVWNFDLGEFSEAQPIWIKVAEETTGHDVYTFSDGTQLRTVGHHVFNKEAGAFTKLKLAETPVGTTTFNEKGEEVTLLSKEQVIEPTRYYNVWTQYHLNLFADGILTSNRFNNIYPIVDMKFVKDNRALRSVDEFAGIDSKYITGLRLQEQTYSAEYISSYVHDRLEQLDIANQVEQGI